MKRLTFKNPDGTWGVTGMNEENQDKKMYSVACKLRDYEDCGMDPIELQNKLSYEIRIGSDIQGYVIQGIFDNKCIAYRARTSEWCVWYIDCDRMGVRTGRYFTDKRSAIECFVKQCFNFAICECKE